MTFLSQSLEAQIAKASQSAVRQGMILSSERRQIEALARHDLTLSGSAYVCGVNIRMTAREQDQQQARNIRSMSASQFDNYAYGL